MRTLYKKRSKTLGLLLKFRLVAKTLELITYDVNARAGIRRILFGVLR